MAVTERTCMARAAALLAACLLMPGAVIAGDYRHTGIYPARPAPYPAREPVRIHMEKDRYAQGYLLRIHLSGVDASDVEVASGGRGWLRVQTIAGYRDPGLSMQGSMRRSVRLPADADVSRMQLVPGERVIEVRIPRYNAAAESAP